MYNFQNSNTYIHNCYTQNTLKYTFIYDSNENWGGAVQYNNKIETKTFAF